MKKSTLTFEKTCRSVGQSILVYIALDLVGEAFKIIKKKRVNKKEEKNPDDILMFKDPLNGDEGSPAEDTAEEEITAE